MTRRTVTAWSGDTNPTAVLRGGDLLVVEVTGVSHGRHYDAIGTLRQQPTYIDVTDATITVVGPDGSIGRGSIRWEGRARVEVERT